MGMKPDRGHDRLRSGILSLSISLITFGFAACVSSTDQEQLYRPPTLQATLTPSPTTAAISSAYTQTASTPPPPTATPQCNNNLRFINDLTIPDGTSVPPRSPLDKRWQLENNGSCNWDSRYRLKLIAGPDLGAPREQPLYPARGGTQFTLRMELKAPQEAGSYRSAWQAYSPEGEPFGDPIFIDFVISAP